MANADLRRRFKFFFDHAGYVVGQRAQGAIALARAEFWLEQQSSLTVRWEGDPDGDLGDHAYWCSQERRQVAHAHTIESCSIVRPCPIHHDPRCWHTAVIESLGGIIDADRDYMRVVVAELASEAMSQADIR